MTAERAAGDATPPDLGPLLRPESIAIIGASTNPEIISGLPQRILAQHRYRGRVYPVNPRHAEIDGLRCYPDVAAVPGPVDVALIVVNAERVNPIVAACGRAGVRFAVIVSSGFAEQHDGDRRQHELRAVCDSFPGMRVLGPNAEGLMNVTDGIPIGFSPTINYDRGLDRLHRGDVAVLAHSGGLGFALFHDGLGRGLGFSHVISTGNEVDLDLTDLAEYLLDDPATRVIALFVEGVASAQRWRKLALAARARGKRIVAAKVGDTSAGQRSALAHTAHDSADDGEFARIAAATGILLADDQEQLVDLALTLSRTRTPTGRRTGVITTSGGAGTWLADDLIRAGLELPALSAAVQDRLRRRIPAYGSPANPVDTTAQVLGRGGIAPVLDIVASSGEIDLIVLVVTLADPNQLERERTELAALATRLPMVVYSYTRPAPRSLEILAELGIAYFTSSKRTATALHALANQPLTGSAGM